MTIGSLASGVALALTTVREHKMRSFLTVLGVIIGTGAVIGVGSIIAGLDGAITKILRSFGPNTIVVTRGSGFVPRNLEEMKRKVLTREDAEAIEERCPSVEHVSPYLFPNFD
ncbi:MAG: ABC transporter permease, partial [Bryobacteraceae bacterium]